MFVYVFCEEGKEYMLARGAKLMSADDIQKRYIFLAEGNNLFFSDATFTYALSEVLAF